MVNKAQLRVKEGLRTELTVSHNNNDLTFLHPAYGPDTYANVGLQIDQNGLARPTMAQTASLVHTAFNSNDRYSNEIKHIMKRRRLWAFTGSLYIQNKGAYVQDNPEIIDGMPFMDESDLVKKLESSDPTVRFVPFGFKIGKMKPSELAKNDYIKATAGEEGAEKIAEVAGKFEFSPRLFGFKSTDKPLARVSALGSDRDFNGRLYVFGGYSGGDKGGYAFGVRKTDKASKS